jgi:predicted acylesterase/phospholipase RssA
MLPKRLVFAGGGTRCLVFLQSLVHLESHGVLRHVNEYWGTSAGSLIASLYALSKSASTLQRLMKSVDYTKFRDIDIGNLVNINSTWGLDDGKSLTTQIELLFEAIEVGAKSKCMRDVEGLHIVVSDLNDRESLVLHAGNYPNLRIVEAVRASMSLPIFLKPYIYKENGHYWVDGGVRHNFPWDLLPNDASRDEALGFAFSKFGGTLRTFNEYMFSMVHFDEPKKLKEFEKKWKHNILWHAIPPFPAWFANLRADDYALIDAIGHNVAEEWMRNDKTMLPIFKHDDTNGSRVSHTRRWSI